VLASNPPAKMPLVDDAQPKSALFSARISLHYMPELLFSDKMQVHLN
jgi:hypothetical protein